MRNTLNLHFLLSNFEFISCIALMSWQLFLKNLIIFEYLFTYFMFVFLGNHFIL